MITGFLHKGLEAVYRRRGLDPELPHLRKLLRVLAALDAASDVHELDLPSFHLEALDGRLKAAWAIWIFDSWHLTFNFHAPHAIHVNYVDLLQRQINDAEKPSPSR